MKIAHVTSEICRMSAGLGVAVAAISAVTQYSCNEVRVFGLTSPEWVRGDSVVWSGAPATVFETAWWSGPLFYAPGLLPALLKFDPDIVHLHGLWTYPSIAMCRWHRKTGRSYVVSAHGMLISASLNYNPVRKKAARHFFQDKVLRAASVLHATSVDEENAYRKLGFNNRTELIPLGIDVVPLPVICRDSQRRRALLLGRLHHQKGIDWLIDAWIKLESDFPDWDLAIVGPPDPDYAQEIEQIKKRVSGRRVSFLGSLYAEEKNRCIVGSELFVMPSRSENFGYTAAESLMMEVPVIATKGTPWSGLVSNDAGWWIEPGAFALETALREAMQLSREELRIKGKNGRTWIERDFSWSVIGGKWQQVYESLATKRN